ncbi:MAG: family 78 glycoside hydrolase catalytic domain [Phycisphaerales bacterium]
MWISLWTVAISSVIFISGCETGNTQPEHTSLQVSHLRCEYRVNPLGIDIISPRLSWIIESEGRGQKQTAYQILVASTRKQLDANQGDLWDSRKVQSDETIDVAYRGNTLVSDKDYFWKVRVWDKDDIVSDWSTLAKWSMGLLNSSAWQAQWIGYDPSEVMKSAPEIVKQANWIWTEANASQGTQPGSRYFRRRIDIPSQWKIKTAICYISADNMFTLYVNGQQVKSGTSLAMVHQISLASYLGTGSNILAVQATNDGSSTNPAGLLVALTIISENDEVLNISSDERWCISSQEVTGWKTMKFDDSGWSKAAVLGSFGMSPWQDVSVVWLPPACYLRRDFNLASKVIKKARLYASALGIYQIYINGQRVSQDYFSPGWSDYSKRVYYRTYDITEVLRSGENAIGGMLADGWYAGYVGPYGDRNHYGQYLRLLCQLNIEYEDGTTQILGTGPDWKASLGPIIKADLLQGETYDARRELQDWNRAGYDCSSWNPVVVGSDEVHPIVQAAVSEPVVIFKEVNPISVSEPTPGQYVFDMGQNFAGVVQLRVQGKTGQSIQLRHAERLNPDGTIYTTNLRCAAATDTYICKGDGQEIWQPCFTFHGFQYVELTGLDKKPELDMITGLAMSSDTPAVGTFECSDPMINKLQSNIVWTQRANFIDIPTDCPQRDERLGWTGDAQIYINTACYQNDMQAFFTKWLTDLTDSQRSDGQFPMVAPLKAVGDDGGPAWADAGIICPWTIYKMYGDKRVLEKHYKAMKKYITFCKERCTNELLPPDQFHCFGDWLNINDDTTKDVIYMAYFGYSTNLMSKISETLGKTEDSANYQQLFEQIKVAFKKAYIQPDGKIKGDTQSAYVMAIAYDLLGEDMRRLAAEHLIRRIEECNWHLSTGFIGTKDLMLALAKIDRNDIAYRLLHNDTFPSWGFSIKHGATSIWERWNGWTSEQGFADPIMNSFSHYSFGAVCQWIFENIGGIQTEGPAFKHIILKPQPGGKLTWAKTGYHSIRGNILTEWELKDSVFHCSIVIPPNTTATLYLPAAKEESVSESKKTLQMADGILSTSYQMGTMVIKLSSGRYNFQTKMN